MHRKKTVRFIVSLTVALFCLFFLSSAAFASYTVTLKADPEEGGTVSGGGEFPDGQDTTFLATPNDGYTFVGWFRDDDTLLTEDTTFLFDIEMDRTYTAKFEKALTANIAPEPAIGGTVEQSGSGTYVNGQEVTLTASPNEGYQFLGWYDASSLTEPVETNQIFTFNMEEPVSYIARFGAEYRLDANVSPANGGEVQGTGVFTGGTIVTLEAIAGEDYRFTGWVSPSEPDTVISEDAKYTFNLDANMTLTATFDYSYAYVGTRVAIILVLCGGGAVGAFIFYRHSTTIKSKNYKRPRSSQGGYAPHEPRGTAKQRPSQPSVKERQMERGTARQRPAQSTQSHPQVRQDPRGRAKGNPHYDIDGPDHRIDPKE